jgi:hypothetical protein
MISCAGECDSNGGGSEITEREMMIMVVKICVGECVMSCHVMSCHVMSCHVMSCHVMCASGDIRYPPQRYDILCSCKRDLRHLSSRST